MRAYRFFAYLLAVEVVIQAAAIALASFGMTHWVLNEGGVVNKALIEDREADFSGAVGFMIHGMNGMMLIPILALVFLIISFFAKFEGASKWAGIVFLLVVVQVALGISGVVWLGPLHAINAFGIFAMAIVAARKASVAAPAAAPVAT